MNSVIVPKVRTIAKRSFRAFRKCYWTTNILHKQEIILYKVDITLNVTNTWSCNAITLKVFILITGHFRIYANFTSQELFVMGGCCRQQVWNILPPMPLVIVLSGSKIHTIGNLMQSLGMETIYATWKWPRKCHFFPTFFVMYIYRLTWGSWHIHHITWIVLYFTITHAVVDRDHWTFF